MKTSLCHRIDSNTVIYKSVVIEKNVGTPAGSWGRYSLDHTYSLSQKETSKYFDSLREAKAYIDSIAENLDGDYIAKVHLSCLEDWR